MNQEDISLLIMSSTDPAIGRGQMALRWWFQEARNLNPELPQDFWEFLKLFQEHLKPVSETFPNALNNLKSLIVTIGEGILVGGTPGFMQQGPVAMSEEQVKQAMYALADKGQGKLPTSIGMFVSYLSNQASEVSFMDALSYTAQASAVQVAQGVQEVGKEIIDTGKSVIKYKNLILLALASFGAYIVYQKTTKGMPAKANPEETEEEHEEHEDAGDENFLLSSNPKKKKKFKRALHVQTLLFSKAKFATRRDAQTWAKKNGYKAGKVEAGNKFWRIRQKDPALFDRQTFRTVKFRKKVSKQVFAGIEAVMGVLKKD